MSFNLLMGDITNLKVDAIVNAANTELKIGGGVCGAIFCAAGPKKLEQACDMIGTCPVGESVITKGYESSAKYIIHTVGPVWRGGNQGEKRLLENAYNSALTMATEHDCQSIAFPLISSGIYGYPKLEAIKVAVNVIEEYLATYDIDVFLILFDEQSYELAKKIKNTC